MSKLRMAPDPQMIIAWDFDGVINHNTVDGQFLWTDTFETDIGHSLEDFSLTVFGQGFDDVIVGKTDLRDRIEAWANEVGYDAGPDALLSYWFTNDALLNEEVCAKMDALSDRKIRQIIVTNNEARRASYIEREMGFSSRVEHVFASGRMGVRKPNSKYFTHVTDALRVVPERMMLIDDCAINVQAAISCGWRGFHFTNETSDQLDRILGLHSAG